MRIHDFYSANDLIGNVLQKNKPASILRIDNSSSYGIHELASGRIPSNQFVNEVAMIEGGIVPSNLEYLFNVVWKKTFQIMLECDVLGMLDISGNIRRDQQYLSTYFTNKDIFTDYLTVDPIALLGASKYGKVETPWTSFLQGKKVLVLSSHANTIKHQWNKINLIWGENKDLVAPFQLVDAISTPFHPNIDDRQYPDCDNFESLIEITKRRIDNYDYDVLLSGISTQSPFYVEHAKNKGKIGIHIGGVLQLFFGILGERWFGIDNEYIPWRKYRNEHWIYPMKEDEPQRRLEMQNARLESSYAYWKRT